MGERRFDLNRRTLLKSSLLGTSFATLPGFSTVSAFAAPGDSKFTGPVVETTEGKVRGVLHNGVHVRARPPTAPAFEAA